MNFILKRFLAAVLLGSSCAPNISLKDELNEFCIENQTSALCSSKDLQKDLESFCASNSHLLLCADPSEAIVTFLKYCTDSPDTSFCSSKTMNIAAFCDENPAVDLCLERGVQFMVDSLNASVLKKSVEKGTFLTLGGVSVPYVRNEVVYRDGARILETVFPQGLLPGTVVEGGGLARFFPGVLPPSGDVGVVYLQNPVFTTLFAEEAVTKELCDGLSLRVQRYGSTDVQFMVKNDLGENVLEEVLAQGEYEVLNHLGCPEASYLVSNSGSSFFLARVQSLEELSVVDASSCFHQVASTGKSFYEFLAADSATPDGYFRQIMIEPPDVQRGCSLLFYE